jgi:hypothetical protein
VTDPFLSAYKDDPRFIAFAQKNRSDAEERSQALRAELRRFFVG